MTNEELYASIYSHDTVYRPPQEEESALLEVCLGCSWGKCLFCDFAKDPFTIHPMERIWENARILGQLEPRRTRVFCLGENALTLSMVQLRQVFEAIRQHMPRVTEVAMYARVDDILRKSEEELLELKALGLCDLHIGVESGSDSILLMMNKGITSRDTIEALHRLDRVGIGYYVTVILGLGGKTFRNLHAIETARMLNQVHPKHIWCLALTLWPGTPLYKMVQRGEYDVLSPWEILLEERILVENLNIDCMFMDTTALGKFTIQGFLPEGKVGIIRTINQLLS